MSEGNLHSEIFQPPGRIAFGDVRSAHGISLIKKNFGDPRHPDATNRDEMEVKGTISEFSFGSDHRPASGEEKRLKSETIFPGAFPGWN
jgi:hypothetical protein